ncbi:Pentalenolactone D synthase [Neonectria ditissima]|uniref:Pentalenolactone D synthase n=1 Tax=Neonectria ditissima TaxID=78410 RepID=A0A0P7AR82_9HYPO|nr:Pentalenolactone D synthase [Neonectria ditissima]
MPMDLAIKYAQEREKRIRPDGQRQYVSLRSPRVQDLGKDPWADYRALASQEPPLSDGSRIKFLVIGGGHNGLLFAYRLIEAGFKSEDICVVDVAGGFGGTWYWNRYPGLMCDIESYVYLPLLEETGYVPKHKYSYGPEIRGQSERIAAKWNIRGLFCTKVNSQTWDDKKGCWSIEMIQTLGPEHQPRDISVEAQFVFNAGGLLSIPKVPDVPGFEEFRSRSQVFHTSRWDYECTGGSEENPELINLRDKRVAIIGTGATAVQVVPHLAKWAKHLYVVQRTPSYCGERRQRETDPETWARVADGKGWQNNRRTNFNHFITNDPAAVDLVDDGWTDTPAVAGLIGGPKIITPDRVQEHIDSLFKLDTKRSEKVRARIEREVQDPDTAEKLKPWYPAWCKRPTFNDDYLSTFNRPNVTLIDTDGKGIQKYTERGLLCGEEEVEIDVLVMATGFLLGGTQSPSDRMSSAIIGRDERPIADKWDSGDFGTLFGISTHQFPNMFAMLTRGTAGSYNVTSSYDSVALISAHVVAEASRAADTERLVIEVTKEGEDRYSKEVAARSLWYAALATCTPSYFTAEGDSLKPPKTAEEATLRRKRAGWGAGIVDYQRMIEEYMGRDENKLEGFDVRTV